MTKTVGELVKESRESLGVSQRVLTETVNKMFKGKENKLSRRHLSNVENGTKNFSINKLNLVTLALLDLGAK